MPPPKSPASAGKQGKLPTSNASNASNQFSESTKLKTTKAVGNECWACGGDGPQICHVVAREDCQAPSLAELGILNIPISSFRNAIPLCPSCHAQFDRYLDPGLVIVPDDLQFFIDEEMKNRELRRQAAEGGEIMPRQVPDHDAYMVHQVAQGRVAMGGVGGLYRPIFLKSYFGRRLGIDLTRFSPQPREWHGAPLAAVRRAWMAFASHRFIAYHPTTYMKLHELFCLYFLPDEFSSYDPSTRPADCSHLRPDNAGGKRKHEGQEKYPSKKYKDSSPQENPDIDDSPHDLQGLEEVDGDVLCDDRQESLEGLEADDDAAHNDMQDLESHGHDDMQEIESFNEQVLRDYQDEQESRPHALESLTYCPYLQKYVPSCWSLGPEVTAEQAIRDLAPLLSQVTGVA